MKKEQDKQKHSSIEKYLITKIPIVKENETVKGVLSILEKISNKYDSVDYIYVTDMNGDLKGMFYVQELFNKPKETPIKRFMQKIVVSVSLDTEIEKVAHVALKHNLKQVPVTLQSKKIIGVISSRQILSVINRSLKKDIFHFAGIHRSHLEFENSMEIPLVKAVKDRLFWLIIGFVGAMFMALYINMFEETLAKYVIIASFIPAIVYISDALGTQLQTIFVRDLAVLGKEIKLKKYFLKQMIIGFFIAAIIGIIMLSFISIFWEVSRTAFAISLASFSTLIVTAFTALLITLVIQKFKFDPALGSGPLATIISDVTSVIIYFLIVVWLI